MRKLKRVAAACSFQHFMSKHAFSDTDNFGKVTKQKTLGIPNALEIRVSGDSSLMGLKL
jgi:hypothetical protein